MLPAKKANELMRLADLLLFAGYTVASVASLIMIKMWAPAALARWNEGQVISQPGLWVCAGAALYATSFLVWMAILTRNDVTLAYPMAIGLTLLFSTIAAKLVLQEAMSASRIAGMITIMLGIVMVVRS